VASVTGKDRMVGCEADHLTMERAEKFNTFLQPKRGMDVAPATMLQRMMKSPAEIALVKHGANVADVGGYAIRDAIRVGARLRGGSPIPNTATRGCGSSQASTLTERTTR